MGKSKNKTHSEVQHLRGKIRKLEAKLKYYQRREHIQEVSFEEAIDENEIETIDSEPCQNCGKGVVLIVDLKYVKLKVCDVCKVRTKI